MMEVAAESLSAPPLYKKRKTSTPTTEVAGSETESDADSPTSRAPGSGDFKRGSRQGAARSAEDNHGVVRKRARREKDDRVVDAALDNSVGLSAGAKKGAEGEAKEETQDGYANGSSASPAAPALSASAAAAVEHFAAYVLDLADITDDAATLRKQEQEGWGGADGGAGSAAAVAAAEEEEAAAAAAPAPPAAAATTAASGEAALTREQVSRAYQEVGRLAKAEAVAAADPDHLKLLLRLLARTVRAGGGADAFKLAAKGEARAAAAALEAMDAALEAAAAELTIMAAPGLDRRLLEDENVEDCILLMRQHITCYVARAFDAEGALSALSAGGGEAAAAERNAKKKKQAAAADWARPLRKKVVHGLPRAYELLERMEALVAAVPLDDAFLLQLCQASTAALAIDCAAGDAERLRPLHLEAVSLLQSAFGRYPEHRPVILEDVFGLWARMPPPGKRGGLHGVPLSAVLTDDAPLRGHALRLFGSSGPASPQAHVHTISALVMLLVQSCVRKPLPQPTDAASSSSAAAAGGGSSDGAGVGPAARVAGVFAQGLLGRCAKKEQGQAFRPLLGPFVEDLCAAVALPEWPGAELLLEALRRAFFSQLQALYSAQNSLETPFANVALDVAGRIAARIAGLRAVERERPIKLPAPSDVPEATISPAKAPSSSDAAAVAQLPGTAGGSEVVACVCGGAVHDVFMLDCDRCHRWFHGVCVGVLNQADAPAVWFCAECTMLRQVSLQRAALRERRNAAERHSFGGSGVGASACGSAVVAAAAAAADGENDVEEAPEWSVLRQLLLNHLTPRSRLDPWCRQARRVHVARWMEEAAKGARGGEDSAAAASASACAHFQDQWDVQPESVQRRPWEELSMPANGSAALTRHLLCGRELCQSFDHMLPRLLALTGLGAASMRARVIRAVGNVVAADPCLMARSDVRRAVTERFLIDVSIAVRQAALELVGELILGAGPTDGPRLLEAYYGDIMERLADCGVSVRKSALKILRAALQAWPMHRRRAQICQALVARAGMVKEEDTVRDLIRDTFYDIWFKQGDPGRATGPSNAATATAAAAAAAGSAEEGVAAGAAAAGGACGELTEEEALRAAALQIVEVVGGVRNTDWLVQLLRGLLFGHVEGDKARRDDKKRKAAASKHCQRLVDCLVGMLLRVDEGQYPLPLSQARAEKQLLDVVTALHVFCRASPALLVPHMEHLYPYLAGENGLPQSDEFAIVLMVSSMTYHVLPLLDRPDVEAMRDVVKLLVRATLRSAIKPIQSAVRCLARLVALVTKDPAPVQGLLRRFYNVLHKYCGEDGNAVPLEAPEARANVRRGLVVVGCICHNMSFDKTDAAGAAAGGNDSAAAESEAASALRAAAADDEAEMPLPALVPLDATTPRAVYEMLRRFIERGDPELQSSALTGLASLLSGAPRLALVAQRHGLVETMLSDDVPPAVLCQALGCLRTVLLAEEERVESGQAREMMAQAGVTIAARVRGDQDAESSAVGSVLQLHVPVLLRRLLHPRAEVRHAAVLLLGTLLRQGLVNPLEAMSHLVALQTDEDAEVRGEALRCLLLENEKGRDFLQPRLMEGVCLAYSFQRASFGAARPLLPPADHGAGFSALLGPVYGTCIRANRQTRFSCLKQLLSLFYERRAIEINALLRKTNAQAANSAGGGDCSGGSAEAAGEEATQLPLGLLEFVCGTLAYLPYDTQEEPLFLIHHINRYVSVQGGIARDALHGALERCGVLDESKTKTPTAKRSRLSSAQSAAQGDEMKAETSDLPAAKTVAANGNAVGAHTEEDAATASAMNGHAAEGAQQHAETNGAPVASAAAVAATSSGDLGTAACTVAAMSMLMGLKHFLKTAYALTDARCQGYDPREGTKASERPANRPEALPDFELPAACTDLTEMIETDASGGRIFEAESEGSSGNDGSSVRAEVAEVSLRCYKEFKALMKGDPSDYLVPSAAAASEGASGRAKGRKSGGGGGGGTRKSSGGKTTPRGRKRGAAAAAGAEDDAEEVVVTTGKRAAKAAAPKKRTARKKRRTSDVLTETDDDDAGAGEEDGEQD